MKRRPAQPQPKAQKPTSPPPPKLKGGMTDAERVALSAVTSMGGSLAGEVDIGEMQALIAGAQQGRKKRPAGKEQGPGTKRKPGPRRRTRG
jgi:hypothetical protein